MRINWHRSFDSNNPTCRGINQGITAKPVGLCSFCRGNLDIKTSTCCDLPFRGKKKRPNLEAGNIQSAFFLDAISLNSIRTISSSSPGKRTSKYLDIYVCVSVCLCVARGVGLHFQAHVLTPSVMETEIYCDNADAKCCTPAMLCRNMAHIAFWLCTQYSPGLELKMRGGKITLVLQIRDEMRKRYFFPKKRGAKTREHIMFHESASDKNGDTGNKRMSLRISWRDWRLKQYINVSRFLLLVWGYVWF